MRMVWLLLFGVLALAAAGVMLTEPRDLTPTYLIGLWFAPLCCLGLAYWPKRR